MSAFHPGHGSCSLAKQLRKPYRFTLRALACDIVYYDGNVSGLWDSSDVFTCSHTGAVSVFPQNDRKMDMLLDQLQSKPGSEELETRSGGGSAASEEVLTKLTTLDGNLNHRSVTGDVQGGNAYIVPSGLTY